MYLQNFLEFGIHENDIFFVDVMNVDPQLHFFEKLFFST